MRFFRTQRFAGALLALISILFTQIAVAGYVCPRDQIQQVAATIQAAEAMTAAMLDCEGMDHEQRPLCEAQVKGNSLSLERTEVSSVSTPPIVLLALTTVAYDLTPPPFRVREIPPTLGHATAPPLVIRNCCFRI